MIAIATVSDGTGTFRQDIHINKLADWYSAIEADGNELIFPGQPIPNYSHSSQIIVLSRAHVVMWVIKA